MRRFLYSITGLIFLVTSGCVAGKAPSISDVGSKAIVSEYRERALSLEKEDELQQALFAWQVVIALHPEDIEAQAKIDSLETLTSQKGNEHFEKAKDLAEKGEWKNAVRHAVAALRYDPDNLKALSLIYKEKDMIQHQVEPGDTLVTIAEKYFRDPTKVSIIAYFNDLIGEMAPVIPGMVLVFPHLPVIEDASQDTDDTENDALLAEARKEFKVKKYNQVIRLARRIVDQNSYQQEAQFMLNTSYLAIGQEHLQKGEFAKADKALVEIAEGFPGLKEALAELERQKQKEAEVHYRQGVKYYLNENLTKAVVEWQQALDIYPDHARAAENIEKTMAILEKLEAVH